MNSFIKRVFAGLSVGILSCCCGCAGLGAATVGAIIYYNTSKNEVATVQLKANADRVYQQALEMIRGNPDIQLVKQDDADHLIELTDGKLAASLKVTSLSEHMTQLTIVSESSGRKKESTELVLNGVKNICEKMNVSYTVNP